MDTGIIVHDRLHIDPTRELAALRVGKTLGQNVKFPVHGILVHSQIHRDRLEVQRQCGAVTDGVREGILAHIAAAVFCGTKGGKGVLIDAVDGGTCQAKEERIRESGPHFNTQIAFLGAVALVHHDDDVISKAQFAGDLLETENRSYDDFSNILPQHGHQLFTGRGRLQISHIRGMELGGDLGLQIQTIVHDQDRGVHQIREHAQFDRGKLHQIGFARPLKMPDQALFRITGPDTVHDHIRALILLVPGDDLIFTILAVSGIQGEELEQVHHLVGRNHILYAGLNRRQRAV